MSQTLPLPAVAARELPDTAAQVRPLLGAIGSFAVLGLCAGLGLGGGGAAARAIPSGLLVGGGALLLTGPALVVMHQFLGLSARPDALVQALARAFVVAGQLALGLAPLVLFFSATSSLVLGVFPLVMAGVGGLALAEAVRLLRLAESEASGTGELTRTAKTAGLVLAWAGLTVLVALRIAVDIAGFVAGA